jgi:hypothetical protein
MRSIKFSILLLCAGCSAPTAPSGAACTLTSYLPDRSHPFTIYAASVCYKKCPDGAEAAASANNQGFERGSSCS